MNTHSLFHSKVTICFGDTLLGTDWWVSAGPDPYSCISYIFSSLRWAPSGSLRGMECTVASIKQWSLLSAAILSLTQCNISGPLSCVETVVISLKPTLFPGGGSQSQLWYLGTLLTQSGALSHWVLGKKEMDLCREASIYSSRYKALWELASGWEFTVT